MDVLFFFHIPRTIARVFAGEFVRMCLDGIRVKYLYHFTEVYALHQIINIFVIVVVGKNDECLRYIARLGQTYDEMAKVFYAIVDLEIIFRVNGIALGWIYFHPSTTAVDRCGSPQLWTAQLSTNTPTYLNDNDNGIILQRPKNIFVVNRLLTIIQSDVAFDF